MISVSVVVPLFRSRATVAPLYQRLCEALAGEQLEILFVDDHCPEDSFAVAREIARRDPRVRAVRLACNVGQQRAVLFGLSAARGAHVVVMDADLQDDPAVVPLLLQRARDGADAVFATRAGNYESAPRLVTSRVFKRLLTGLTGMPLYAGMFLVVSAEVARRITERITATPYLVFMAAHWAERVASVATPRAARAEGDSAYTTLARLRAALAAVRCVAEVRLGLTGAPSTPPIEQSAGW